MVQDSIMHKIKHLIEKSKSSDSQAESDSFMLKAQELLAKYNLDSYHVTSYEQVKKEGVMEDRIKYEGDWEMRLLSALSRGNFCRIVIQGDSGIISVIGLPSNVEVVLYLFEFFRKEIMDLGMRSYSMFLYENEVDADMLSDINKGRKKAKKKTTHQEQFIEDYLFGAVAGVKKKMDDAEFEMAKANHEYGVMVVGQKDLVDAYMRKNYPYLGSSRASSGNPTSGAFGLGSRDGYGIQRTGLGSGQKRIG